MKFSDICPFCNKHCFSNPTYFMGYKIECQNEHCLLNGLTRYSIYQKEEKLIYNIGIMIFKDRYMLYSRNYSKYYEFDLQTKIYKNGELIYNDDYFVEPDAQNINNFVTNYISRILNLITFQ
jgi:hypothetical protein